MLKGSRLVTKLEYPFEAVRNRFCFTRVISCRRMRKGALVASKWWKVLLRLEWTIRLMLSRHTATTTTSRIDLCVWRRTHVDLTPYSTRLAIWMSRTAFIRMMQRYRRSMIRRAQLMAFSIFKEPSKIVCYIYRNSLSSHLAVRCPNSMMSTIKVLLGKPAQDHA